MARTKQTPRKPTGRKPGEPAVSRKSKKGFWGTPGRMVQRPIPSLPPHPQRRGFFYGGMYINVDTVEASIMYMCAQYSVQCRYGRSK